MKKLMWLAQRSPGKIMASRWQLSTGVMTAVCYSTYLRGHARRGTLAHAHTSNMPQFQIFGQVECSRISGISYTLVRHKVILQYSLRQADVSLGNSMNNFYKVNSLFMISYLYIITKKSEVRIYTLIQELHMNQLRKSLMIK